MKLNLGAGNQRYEGYIGVDLSGYAADVIHDLTQPLPYEGGSVEEIMTHHTLEHFSLWQARIVLRDWRRVLCDGGLLWGSVPDGPAIAQLYLEAVRYDDWRLRSLCLTNFVGATYEDPHAADGQAHKMIYDRQLLWNILAESGFNRIGVQSREFGAEDLRLVFAAIKGGYVASPVEGIGFSPQEVLP